MSIQWQVTLSEPAGDGLAVVSIEADSGLPFFLDLVLPQEHADDLKRRLDGTDLAGLLEWARAETGGADQGPFGDGWAAAMAALVERLNGQL